jgi:hypothetical protein
LGARQKLNTANLFGCLAIAGFIGAATQSFGLFIILFGILFALAMHDGNIRLQSSRR